MYYLFNHECADIEKVGKIKSSVIVYFNFIIGLCYKMTVISLCNLEISGLHKYKRSFPFFLPILCKFLPNYFLIQTRLRIFKSEYDCFTWI